MINLLLSCKHKFTVSSCRSEKNYLSL